MQAQGEDSEQWYKQECAQMEQDEGDIGCEHFDIGSEGAAEDPSHPSRKVAMSAASSKAAGSVVAKAPSWAPPPAAKATPTKAAPPPPPPQAKAKTDATLEPMSTADVQHMIQLQVQQLQQQQFQQLQQMQESLMASMAATVQAALGKSAETQGSQLVFQSAPSGVQQGPQPSAILPAPAYEVPSRSPTRAPSRSPSAAPTMRARSSDWQRGPNAAQGAELGKRQRLEAARAILDKNVNQQLHADGFLYEECNGDNEEDFGGEVALPGEQFHQPNFSRNGAA